MRLNFGIAAVATLLSGVRVKDLWPLCTINGLGTECDLSISPSGCCTAPNLAPAITFCNISMDYTPKEHGFMKRARMGRRFVGGPRSPGRVARYWMGKRLVQTIFACRRCSVGSN
jgi:hypothetical protein